MKLFSRLHSGYLFLIAFLTTVVVTPLFQKGVFGDGLMYLTVAFNRFKGYGSFWKQHYSNTSMSFFCEQPPLYFESLGVFYKMFGGHELAEKIYTTALLAATVIFSLMLWRRLTGQKTLGWLVSLLVFCVPVFSWTYCNQLIETLVAPLALLAFYLQLRFAAAITLKQRLLFLGGGTAVLLALFLTKGLQSVFVVAALFFAALTVGRKACKSFLWRGALVVTAFAGVLGALFLMHDEARFWLTSYFQKRLVATFNDKGATAAHHLEIVIRFFSELLPVIGLLVLVSVYVTLGRKYPFRLQWENFKLNRRAHWLILISLSGSLPLAVTLEQRGFYLSPAFPFMIIGLSLLFHRYLVLAWGLLARGREKLLGAASGTALAGALFFFLACKDGYKRDEEMMKDVAQIITKTGYGDTIGINQSTWNTFSLHSYLNKRNDNHLAVTDTLRFFVQEQLNPDTVPSHYKKVDIPTKQVHLYRRRTER